MDCLSYGIVPNLFNSPLSSLSAAATNSVLRRPLGFRLRHATGKPRVAASAAAAGASSAGHCEYGSSLNTPHEPRSWAGQELSGVLQNEPHFFHVAAAEQLAQLAVERDGAVARMDLSWSSPESSLHRRIAELKTLECRNAVEDVMYMLIIYKFSSIRVPLVPRLSKCIYNGRLEILPSKDWELESIYSLEVLDMIREHLSAVVGLRAQASVREKWATTQIRRLQLGQVYAASILYGYFLKSASFRHHLDTRLALNCADLPLGPNFSLQLPELLLPYGYENLVLGHTGNTQSISLCQGSISRGKNQDDFRCYVTGFDSDTLQRCAKLKTKEAVNLIEKHSLALFGDKKVDSLETDDMISTSFSSLKRLVLEAVAFGSFLWDTEELVDSVYKLEGN